MVCVVEILAVVSSVLVLVGFDVVLIVDVVLVVSLTGVKPKCCVNVTVVASVDALPLSMKGVDPS